MTSTHWALLLAGLAAGGWLDRWLLRLSVWMDSRAELLELRAKLHAIRNQSLEWVMTCHHDCPVCDQMYETIKGSAGHPRAD